MNLTLRRALVVPCLAAAFLCAGWADWPAFRHDALRTGEQAEASPLSNPLKVPTLKKKWRFPAEDEEKVCSFRASPIVYGDQVFIGNSNGYFYALDAETGKKNWQFPPAGSKGLLSRFTCNVSSDGIASSAVIARIGSATAVIFGAPDPSFGTTRLGEGRLFALDTESGRLIWATTVIARLTGCTDQCPSPTEFHENLGHSSPLVFGDKVYVGIGDHCDNPVQQGRVVAVKLANGDVVREFTFCSTGTCGDRTRGGGIWSPLAGWQHSLFVTTGNTRSGADREPRPNYGLSLLRLNAATGRVIWPFKAVSWKLDGDSDWSAAPTIMLASCGPMVVSTQKDGWTHALNAIRGSHRWSYPPQKIPFKCEDGSCHGDSRYMRSGVAWRDVYVTMNGGLNLTRPDVSGGYHRLHAFNVCEPERSPNRLRWLIDVPSACCHPAQCCTNKCCAEDCNYCLGNPTITGGIVYIGTDQGHLMAIADPTVASPVGKRCSHPDVKNEDCVAMGYRLVPQPQILADVQLEGSMVYSEPALANGRVYVSTGAGFVYMLQPDP
ncbi:MAG: hypothetical protein QOH06_3093 [Acidobacteriota bacterium]|jgi:outer membrane protein assembly factor BamB|nr:hypothetical protein [Acidobacteriota bacterium]